MSFRPCIVALCLVLARQFALAGVDCASATGKLALALEAMVVQNRVKVDETGAPFILRTTYPLRPLDSNQVVELAPRATVTTARYEVRDGNVREISRCERDCDNAFDLRRRAHTSRWETIAPIYEKDRNLGRRRTVGLWLGDMMLPTTRLSYVGIWKTDAHGKRERLVGFLEIFDGSLDPVDEAVNHNYLHFDLPDKKFTEDLGPIGAPADGKLHLTPLERTLARNGASTDVVEKRRHSADRPKVLELGAYFLDPDPTVRAHVRNLLAREVIPLIKAPEQTTLFAFSDKLGARTYRIGFGFKDAAEVTVQPPGEPPYREYVVESTGEDFVARLKATLGARAEAR